MVNAGAKFVDQEVVRDGNLITSRTPADLPAFGRALVEAIAEAKAPAAARRSTFRAHGAAAAPLESPRLSESCLRLAFASFAAMKSFPKRRSASNRL